MGKTTFIINLKNGKQIMRVTDTEMDEFAVLKFLSHNKDWIVFPRNTFESNSLTLNVTDISTINHYITTGI